MKTGARGDRRGRPGARCGRCIRPPGGARAREGPQGAAYGPYGRRGSLGTPSGDAPVLRPSRAVRQGVGRNRHAVPVRRHSGPGCPRRGRRGLARAYARKGRCYRTARGRPRGRRPPFRQTPPQGGLSASRPSLTGWAVRRKRKGRHSPARPAAPSPRGDGCAEAGREPRRLPYRRGHDPKGSCPRGPPGGGPMAAPVRHRTGKGHGQ